MPDYFFPRLARTFSSFASALMRKYRKGIRTNIPTIIRGKEYGTRTVEKSNAPTDEKISRYYENEVQKRHLAGNDFLFSCLFTKTAMQKLFLIVTFYLQRVIVDTPLKKQLGTLKP